MGSILVSAVEKILLALVPLVLKWIGNEALALLTHRVIAESASRADSVATVAAAEAKAEAAAPSDRASLVRTLQDGAF